MEELIYPEYLLYPIQVKKAVEFLDENCQNLEFPLLFEGFIQALGIKTGEGFPITRAYLSGQFCRARINNDPQDFIVAENIRDIGPNPNSTCQGRANPGGLSIFYAANNIETASFEVLQEKDLGLYKVTIGCWSSPRELCVANLLDGSDTDLTNLSFAHSLPQNYLKEWPYTQRESAFILLNYFRKKFKMVRYNGLYLITNIISRLCYSLDGIDGVGYPSVSNEFNGYNIALKDFSMLTCDSVEEWFINKVSVNTLEHHLIRKGSIEPDGSILWHSFSS